MRRRAQRRLASALGGLGVVFVLAAAVRAHEIGTTRVNVEFDDRQSYTIELVTDAASLVEKLEASAGHAPNSGNDAATVSRRLVAFDETFRRRLNVAFDGSIVRPVVRYAVAPAADGTSAALATIRLTGRIPRGSRTFTWTYGWTFASYVLVVRSAASKAPATEWLEGGESSSPFTLMEPAPQVGRAGIAARYLVLGFTHIVPHGLDHMLFVLGLFLLTGRARSILWQVSAFTVAHSITLGLSIYGLISAPAAIVEPMIALSIAYVAIENLFTSELKSWRLALVFAFGLLHGLGFAGALQELGLPRSEFVTALVTFNLGVEGGQLAVIAAASLLVGWQWSPRVWYRQRIVVPASVLIACTALYWTVVRLGF
jgi:hydrogenase/urease accessory protein HupE